MDKEIEWFKSWFDTSWYHTLYKHRNHEEAQVFINKLAQRINKPSGAKMLDAACGSGRHALQLSRLGFNVTGFDLSENSIEEASQYSSHNLEFKVADLREFSSEQSFDVVLNLFTSFGYFESINDNVKVLSNFKACLDKNGMLIIDFFNHNVVTRNLVAEEEKTIDGVDFRLTRKHENGRIVKTIELNDNGEKHQFQERVNSFSLDDFKSMFEKTGFEIVELYGDYQLNSFNEESSPRLIIKACHN